MRATAGLSAIIGLSALLGGCGVLMQRDPSAPPAAEPVDATGAWILDKGTVDGQPIPVVADHPITFSVDGSTIGGTAACNHYGATLKLVDGVLRFDELGSTAMLCGEPDGDVMLSEAAFHRALGGVVGARREGPLLVLFGPTVELLFSRLAPIDVAALVGTDWVLESVVDGDVVSAADGEPGLLRFDVDGTFGGSTGCRSFTGTWTEFQGEVTATQMTMDDRDCPADLAEQDGTVTDVVGGSRPTVEGDRLTLTANGGRGLVYRRATD